MDQNLVAEAPVETQVISDHSSSPALLESSETPRAVQERGVQRTLPEQLSSGRPPLTAVLGDVVFQTVNGHYVTAINGGGIRDVEGPAIITAATEPTAWERFKITIVFPGQVFDKAIQTLRGNYVTAETNTYSLHTSGTLLGPDERFHFTDLSASHPSFYSIQIANGWFLSAGAGGGRYSPAITREKSVHDWERFRIIQCSDEPISGREYGLMAENGHFLWAVRGGGQSTNGIFLAPAKASETKFKLLRQADGTYALQTANGRNYVTAIDGGGHVQDFYPADCGLLSGACIDGYSDLFHTDATRVNAWRNSKLGNG